MDKITVHLLGNPHVEKNGEHVHFPYKKAEGFFYYLCVEKNTTRGELISILWGDDDESSGRKSLREAIYQIKKLFGKEFLSTKGNSVIGINPEQMPEIDWDKVNEDNILDFEDKGFISHFLVKNSYEFENWLEEMQNKYNHLYIDSAQKMLEKAKKTGDEQKIQKYGGLLLRKLPYDEELYCELMCIYGKTGNYNMAIKIYNDLYKLLAEELDVEPTTKTKEMFYQIFKLKEHANVDETLLDSFFYGRNKEMYEVSDDLSRFFADGDAQSLCFCGDSGIGKSTLMKRIQKIVEGYQPIIFSAKCYREEHYFFLNVWQDIFQEILSYEKNGILKNMDIEEEKGVLTKVFSGSYLLDNVDETNQITYQIVERTFIKITQKICRDHKVVIFIDDIHWMDSTSIQLLNRLLLTCGQKNILMITCLRTHYETIVMEELESTIMKDGLKTIYLDAFTEVESDEIIERLCPDLKHEVAKKNNVYQMTHGNPFFLMEMIRIIREKGYTLEISRKTINVIKCRLASLSDEENQILNCMSIFPKKVSIEEIGLLIAMDKLDIISYLENLKEQQLVQEKLVNWELYYLFNHKMFQEYAYDRQSLARKIMCHRTIAEYYDAKYLSSQTLEDLLIVIYHYERCRDREKTYEYKVRYLKQFYSFFHENFPLLDADLTGNQSFRDSPFNTEEIEKLAKEVGEWEDESPNSLLIKMEMHYIFGRYGISIGDYSTALVHIDNCISLAERLDDKQLLLNCYKQLVFYGNQVFDLEVMEKNIEKGLVVLSKEKESDEYGVFIRLKGLLRLQRGEYEEAEKLMWQAIDIFERCGHVSRRHSINISGCYNYLGNIRNCQGNKKVAIEFYEKAIENNTHKVVANGINQSYVNLGILYFELDDYIKAREFLTQAIQNFESHDYYWGRDRAEAYMAMVEIECGNYDDAQDHYNKGKRISDKMLNPKIIKLYEKISKKLREAEINRF